MTDDLLHELEAAEPDPFEITNRDQALFLIEEYDLEAQLLAIRGLVKRNSESDKALEAEIKSLGAEICKHTDEYADYLQDSWIDHLHGSVFLDAAHSMSTVGMLAPFVESLFVAIFKGLRANRGPVDAASDARAAALHERGIHLAPAHTTSSSQLFFVTMSRYVTGSVATACSSSR